MAIIHWKCPFCFLFSHTKPWASTSNNCLEIGEVKQTELYAFVAVEQTLVPVAKVLPDENPRESSKHEITLKPVAPATVPAIKHRSVFPVANGPRAVLQSATLAERTLAAETSRFAQAVGSLVMHWPRSLPTRQDCMPEPVVKLLTTRGRQVSTGPTA